MKSPKLIVLIGVPASGKSSLAKTWLQSEKDAILLSSDALRGIYGKNEEDQSVTGEVMFQIKKLVRYFLRQGRTVIVDATNRLAEHRREFLAAAKEEGARTILAVMMDTPLEECLLRNSLRERKVPDEVIRRMFNSLEKPSITEGFTDIEIKSI